MIRTDEKLCMGCGKTFMTGDWCRCGYRLEKPKAYDRSKYAKPWVPPEVETARAIAENERKIASYMRQIREL